MLASAVTIPAQRIHTEFTGLFDTQITDFTDKEAYQMRRGFGLVWVAFTGVVVGLVAWFAYNAGLAANVAGSGNGTVIVERGGFGFGFFPVLLLILLLLLVFRRRRWGGHWGGRGWGGRGHGPGGHRDWDVPPVIEDKLKSWHDKAHGTTSAESSEGEGGHQQPGS